MLKRIQKIIHDSSGQAMSEYVIVSSALTLSFGIFINTDLFKTEVYGNIYLLLKGLIISASLPIG